jgi:hypothetical protein
MIGVLGFYSRQGLGILPFTTASRMALEPTQPPIQWVPGALSWGVKRPGREADHSPPSSAEAKEWVELYLHSSNMPSWRGAQLKHRDNFTFTFNFVWQLMLYSYDLVSWSFVVMFCPLLMQRLYHCHSVAGATSVTMGFTTCRHGWHYGIRRLYCASYPPTPTLLVLEMISLGKVAPVLN